MSVLARVYITVQTHDTNTELETRHVLLDVSHATSYVVVSTVNVAFFKKQRIVIRKLKTSHPEVSPEIWCELFRKTWDVEVHSLENTLS